jgi:peptide/nickel transport system substrate-binding protein
MKKIIIVIVSIILITVFPNLLIADNVNHDRRNQEMYSFVDNIEIDHLRGGFGVSAVIRNSGEVEVSHVGWSIDFGSLARFGNYSSGTVSRVSAGEKVIIRSGFVFGIGFGYVKVVVGDFSILQNCFMIGPFVFLRHGSGNIIKNPDMIVYFRDTDQRTLDPAEAYDSASTDVINNIYDRLVTFRGNDTKAIYPSLATNWSVESDQLAWTFYLRQGVKFSNGNIFNATDVKYSFDRVLIMNSPDSGVAWILSQCMDLNSTTIIDPYTIQFTLTHPYGGFLALLACTVASIVDRETVEAHGGVIPDTDNIWMQENAVGTGPYMVEENDSLSVILLTKNPSYWGGWNGNHIDKVLCKTTPDLDKRITAIINGNTDITDVPSENLNDIRNKTGVEIFQAPSYDVTLGLFDCASDNTFMADKNVRRALCYAFDYQSAIDSAFNGYLNRLPGCIPIGMPYDETQNNGQPYYNYNLSTAAQILDDAGFVRNYLIHGILYRFNGTSIRIFYNIGNSGREKMAFRFHTALNEIGILSSVIAEEWPQYLNLIYRTNEWEIAFLGWMPDYNDPDDYIAPLVGSAAIGGDTFNTDWENATVDQLILTGKYNIDPHIRSDAYTEAFHIYINDPSLLFIGQNMFARPLRDWLLNYSYNPVPGYELNFYNCYKASLDPMKDFTFKER